MLDKPFFSFLLRWDAFHFVHIAKEGYVFEHEFAFFPGTPFLMRSFARIMDFLGLTTAGGFGGVLVGGAVASLASDAAIIVLYDLTNETFESPAFAYLCSLLYLLSSSPATLRNAPYAEPFFALLSYQGMCLIFSSFYTHEITYPISRIALLCEEKMALGLHSVRFRDPLQVQRSNALRIPCMGN